MKSIICLMAIFSVMTQHYYKRSESDTARYYQPFNLTESDTIIKIDANPSLGFNYAYYLRIPKELNKDKMQYLLVETNNSGTNDTLLHHERTTFFETTKRSLGGALCNYLKVPLLMPIFPRPAKQWQIYTHAFDRDAATIKEGEMKRLDLQLIAMIEHSKTILKKNGINCEEKFLMNGFSASGTFANRFTLIHPTLVAATACGGINAIPILCVNELEKTKLKYPIGTSDFKQLFGETVNLDSYKKVPQFIYMGEKDDNDAVLFDDAYSESERKTIFKVLGKKMMPDRFRKCESVYIQNNVNSTFKIYPGIGHQTDKKVLTEVAEFFTNAMGQK
jgi:hypothetical protein